jgi:hypothetical protein
MRIVTVFAVVVLALVAVLTGPNVAIAEDPDPAGGIFCIYPGDSATRAFARAQCDDTAQASGYDHGILMPCQAGALDDEGALKCERLLCKVNKDGKEAHKFMCAGVPGQN